MRELSVGDGLISLVCDESQPNILVVEDEEMIRRVLARALPALGYNPILADSTDRGKEYYSEISSEGILIAVALLDIKMPRGMDNGFEFADHIVEQGFDPKRIIYMSGFSGEEATHEELKRRKSPFLAKPFGREALRKALESMSG